VRLPVTRTGALQQRFIDNRVGQLEILRWPSNLKGV
jgi:hypothetical protein